MAEIKQDHSNEVQALFRWLRSIPEVGEFDEEVVAQRYAELSAQHETAVQNGKPGWMRTPANEIRDELMHDARAAQLAANHPSMSEDLSQVLVPVVITLVKPNGLTEEYSVGPAPTDTLIEQLAQLTWQLSDNLPIDAIWELCENFIHAYFEGAAIRIDKRGKRIAFTDAGPGPNWKDEFTELGYSTATDAMKEYITNQAWGYNIVQDCCELADEPISLLFGRGQGTGLSVYLVKKG